MFEHPTTTPLAVEACGVDVSDLDLDGLDLLPRVGPDLVEAHVLVAWLVAHPAESWLTDYDVVDYVAAWERVHTFAKAQVTTAMAEFARRPEYLGPDPQIGLAGRKPVGEVARRFPDDELGLRLGVSRAAVGPQLNVALTLAKRLPATREAFATGLLDYAKTRAIVDGCEVLDDESAAAVEAKVLDKAVEQDLSKLRAKVKRAVLRVDPAAAEERRQRRLEDRSVWVTPAEDGMAWLTALLPAAAAMSIERAIDAAARTLKADAGADDPRTLQQLRADCLAQPFTDALRSGVLAGSAGIVLGKHRGQVPQIQVTVAASTLMGVDDLPGQLAGYGPITAQTAREIAADGIWRRILTDPASGTVLDVGTTTYQPPADLARHIEIRDQTCRYPTCNRAAVNAELDHTIRFPDGPTAHDNLSVLCVRHHQLKHDQTPGEQRPRLEQLTPGQLRWTMPTGHQYLVHPPQLGAATQPGT